MTKSEYQHLRNSGIRKACNLYPSYNNVCKTKELCLPEHSLWAVTDYDGLTGQSLYTQTTTEKENRNITNEASLFLTCFVSLQLSGYSNGENKIIWSNPHPSSTLFCRPIR